MSRNVEATQTSALQSDSTLAVRQIIDLNEMNSHRTNYRGLINNLLLNYGDRETRYSGSNAPATSPAGKLYFDTTLLAWRGYKTAGATPVSILDFGSSLTTTSFSTAGTATFKVGGPINVNTTQVSQSAASYDSVSFSVAGQFTGCASIFFKSDGTKMYGLSGNSVIHQYSLPTPWVLTGATYDSVSLDISANLPLTATGLAFKSDGTKLYAIDTGAAEKIVQYSLPTAWVLTGGTYDSISFSPGISSGDFKSRGLFFKSDGTKMYTAGSDNDSVYQFSLSTAWNVGTASYDSVSLSFTTHDTDPTDIFITSDGRRLYILGTQNDSIYQYTLTTAWSLTGARFDTSFSVNAQDNNPVGLFFKSDGAKMFILGDTNNTVYQYSVASGDLMTYPVPGSTLAATGTALSTVGFFTASGSAGSLDSYFDDSWIGGATVGAATYAAEIFAVRTGSGTAKFGIMLKPASDALGTTTLVNESTISETLASSNTLKFVGDFATAKTQEIMVTRLMP